MCCINLNYKTKMNQIVSTVVSLTFFCLFGNSFAKCADAPLPIDPWTLGKQISANPKCGPGANTSSTSISVEPFGLVFQDMFPWPTKYDGCAENIVFIFEKKDKISHLLHRPHVKPQYFQNSHPELYATFMKNMDKVKFPCYLVPFNKVLVWGGQRQLFISLLKKAIKIATYVRDYNCDSFQQPPNTVIMRDPQDVAKILDRNRIANAALNYLYNQAYTNFFCI